MAMRINKLLNWYATNSLELNEGGFKIDIENLWNSYVILEIGPSLSS